jgi:hypothetical protein
VFSYWHRFAHNQGGGFAALIAVFSILSMTTTNAAHAAALAAANPDSLRVLDIEKRRVVTSQPLPSDASPTCDVLVVGGGTGGVAAAEAVARRGVSVILVEPTRTLGGQFTSQLVPVPDENRYIEQENGPSTGAYRALRERVRAHYAALPNIKPGMEKNVGQCWVSRVSGTPDVWEQAIQERLDALMGTGGRLRRIYGRHQIRSVGFLADGRVNYADIVDLDTGRVTRIGARFLLDATEDGSLLALAGLPTVMGQEAKSEFNEPHAPEEARPDWVQSFTYCFLVRWQANGPYKKVQKPAEYDYFKEQGEYTLNYEYVDRGTVPYKMLTTAKGAGGPFWTYRRLVASSSFDGGSKSPEGDIALINWRGNDFNEEAYLGRPLDEQAFVLERAKSFAQGFLYWLQNECPRDDGNGVGYPELQLITGDEMPALGDDGFGIHPYIRESRRLKAKFTLTENHLLAQPVNLGGEMGRGHQFGTSPDDTGPRWGEAFRDSVGCAQYSVDIHPIKGEPHLLTPALPYHIPLGAFLTTSGAVNVLPAAKNIGATRLAAASIRMHPTEWLIGEAAGALAAFCVRRDFNDPSVVRDDPNLLTAFQWDLRSGNIPLYWSDILPPVSP